MVAVTLRCWWLTRGSDILLAVLLLLVVATTKVASASGTVSGGGTTTPKPSSVAASPGGGSPTEALASLMELNLTAYDCAHPDAKEAVLDVSTLPTCVLPAAPARRPVDIRLLVVRDYIVVHVYTCRVEVITELTPASNCTEEEEVEPGEMPVSWPVESSLSSAKTLHYTQAVGRDTCKQLHEGKPYDHHFHSDSLELTIVTKANSTSSESHSFDSECVPTFKDHLGSQYDAVYVNETVKVSLADSWVHSLRWSGRVVMPQGYGCRYEERYCSGAAGDALWDLVPDDQCGDEHSLDVIYEGAAVVFINPRDNSTFFTLTHPNLSSANISYMLGNRTQVCNDEAYELELPKVFQKIMLVAFKTPGQNFSFQSSSLPYVSSSVYPVHSSHYFYIGEFTQRYLDTETGQRLQRQSTAHSACLEHRQQVHVKLAAVRASADPVAALEGDVLEDIEGVRGELVGGVLRLTQCVPVAVRLRNASRCYQEVPVVTAAGVQAFMTSPRRFLQSAGTEVPCDPPPMHRLSGQWVAFDPEPRLVSVAPPNSLGSRDSKVQLNEPLVFAARLPHSTDAFKSSVAVGDPSARRMKAKDVQAYPDETASEETVSDLSASVRTLQLCVLGMALAGFAAAVGLLLPRMRDGTVGVRLLRVLRLHAPSSGQGAAAGEANGLLELRQPQDGSLETLRSEA